MRPLEGSRFLKGAVFVIAASAVSQKRLTEITARIVEATMASVQMDGGQHDGGQVARIGAKDISYLLKLRKGPDGSFGLEMRFQGPLASASLQRHRTVEVIETMAEEIHMPSAADTDPRAERIGLIPKSAELPDPSPVLYEPLGGASVVVHGNHFEVLGPEPELGKLEAQMCGWYGLRVCGKLVPKKNDDKDILILSQKLEWGEGMLGYEANPRNAEAVIKEFGV